MSSGRENINSRVEENVAIVSLNRPERLNAMDTETMKGLYEIVDQMAKRTDVSSIILTGEGRAFSSGSDAKEYLTMTLYDYINHQIIGNRLYQLIEEVDKPVIAAVNGYALGEASSWLWHVI
ncbi:hypothetical protein HS1genome_2003 [Sulfodiicoccus acidiphilus]|uniref:Enoyl-CoA hydratase n=1 Tax=Sulfodiicoccus acidiphilus TaxID=1670455 RepID=A0A348B612_9CREN|nr:enoyl-CoA hydratase/isomerase family protein [Sulfodiicoccus acidiphilus]BBD73614.1 hypothetical protein HS1genome_2003 [Sulfodiicoccus acidiphilus]